MQNALDKIRELHALHEGGLLSREEFDTRKNAILDTALAAPDGPATPLNAGTEIGLMAGQEIGPRDRRYRLERLLAQGGMGQVWQATDLATAAELGYSAQVALKILPPQATRNAGHAKLLIAEATRARRLAHQHIVRVYEWAQDPATASYFIIMECLDGEDLDRLLAREGRLPPERVVRLLAPVADALDYAWDRHQLVHRDLKPANVFVTKDGEVKLLDFGIAARSRATGSAALEAPASSGTSGYRAPEAGRSRQQPSRALDVYAVAAMIHQMLTGRLPARQGEGGYGAVPPGLQAAQWEVVQAGLHADPARRPASVGELLGGLRRAAQAASGPEVGGTDAGPPVRSQVAAAPAGTGMPGRVVPASAPVAPAPNELATQRKAQADATATAAARSVLARQRREQEKQERARRDVERGERKEVLRQQLQVRRAEELEKTRLAHEQAQHKAAQAKAAAAYLAEQQRARAEPAARNVPGPLPDDAAGLATAAIAPGIPAAAGVDVLRDRFVDGTGAGPELVLIRTGRFQMGSHEHERKVAMEAGAQPWWLAREQPQHWVGIERPFAIGRYPVTVGEWRAFVLATGWQQHGELNWAAPGFAQTDMHPVVGVTWWDAQKYLQWLSAATGHSYRLPSEAEWEYACRAATRSAFSFGDTISTALANYDGSFSYNGSARGECRRGTTPVDQFAPNPWGLHDMHGNVWEWIQDVLHDNYQGAPVDGRAWEQGGDPARRVLRGGSWLYNPGYLRSALRNAFSAVMANDIVGFRVVRDPG
jgi:formylglycine-generating enzyme required for sulfatase activity